MKTSLARVLVAAIAGILMIQYREDMVTWLTICIGAMFFLSGVISVVYYFVVKSRIEKQLLLQSAAGNDEETNTAPLHKPTIPIAGIGCAILGAILALMPTTFITYTVYIFAAMVILGAIGEYVSLIVGMRNIRDYENSTGATVSVKCGVIFWIIPTLLLIFGIVAIVYPASIASAPFLFFGMALIVYAVAALIDTIKLYAVRRHLKKLAQAIAKAAEEAAEEETGEIG